MKPKDSNLSDDMASALQTAVLNKCLSTGDVKKANALIPEGYKAAFDINVNLKGVLTREHGRDVKPTSILLNKAVIARLLRNLGATREAAKRALREAAEAAVSAINSEGSVTDILLDEDRELLLTMDEVDRDILQKLPKSRRDGAVKVAAAVKYTRVKLEPQNIETTQAA